MTPLVNHDPSNHGHAPEFITQPEHRDNPATLKAGVAEQLLALPQFKHRDVMELISSATARIKGIPVTDRATAIAILLGAASVIQSYQFPLVYAPRTSSKRGRGRKRAVLSPRKR